MSLKFRRDFGTKNQSPWSIIWRYLCDPRYSHLCRTRTCDRRTDRQTDIQTDTGWQFILC